MDVQANESGALERLIATRVVWVYEKVAGSPAVQRRPDLQLEDILQMGCLAVLEAAQKTNPRGEASVVRRRFALEERRHIGRSLLGTKLVPTIGPGSKPDYETAHNKRRYGKNGSTSFKLSDLRIVDRAVPMKDEAILSRDGNLQTAAISRNRTQSSIENEVMDKAAFLGLHWLLGRLLLTGQGEMLLSAYGFSEDDEHKQDPALEERPRAGRGYAYALWLSRQKALHSLRELVDTYGLSEILRQGLGEDATNRGVLI